MTPTAPYTLIDPLLSDSEAAELLELFERFGSYGMYSEEGLNEGVLHHVLRITLVLEDPHRQTEHQADVSVVDRGQRLRVALGYPLGRLPVDDTVVGRCASPAGTSDVDESSEQHAWRCPAPSSPRA